MYGTIIGVTKGDTRSLDYRSHRKESRSPETIMQWSVQGLGSQKPGLHQGAHGYSGIRRFDLWMFWMCTEGSSAKILECVYEWALIPKPSTRGSTRGGANKNFKVRLDTCQNPTACSPTWRGPHADRSLRV